MVVPSSSKAPLYEIVRRDATRFPVGSLPAVGGSFVGIAFVLPFTLASSVLLQCNTVVLVVTPYDFWFYSVVNTVGAGLLGLASRCSCRRCWDAVSAPQHACDSHLVRRRVPVDPFLLELWATATLFNWDVRATAIGSIGLWLHWVIRVEAQSPTIRHKICVDTPLPRSPMLWSSRGHTQC